jgi:competence protein ComEC
MRDPLVSPLLAVIAGIVLAWQFAFRPWELSLGGGVSIGICWLCRRRELRRLAKGSFWLALAAAGALLYVVQTPAPPANLQFPSTERVQITGCVVEPPVSSLDREQFVLEVAPQTRIRVSRAMRGGALPTEPRYGQRVEVIAKVREPRNFGNPGSFDYVGYLARRHVYWQASVAAGDAPKVLEGHCGSWWRGALFALRTKGLARLDDLYAGNRYTQEMMKALLLGDSSGLQAVWTENFRRTGTYHALVISGAHITVLAAALLFLFRAVRLPILWSLSLTAALAWIYALVSGGDPPVTRSAAGFMIVLACRFFCRRVRPLNLLAVVALGFLAWDARQIFEASFQLSFLCVAALGALAAPVIEHAISPFSKGLRGLDDPGRDPRLESRIASWRVDLRLFAESIEAWMRIPRRWVLAALSAFLRSTLFAIEVAAVSAMIQVALALPMVAYFHRLSLSGLTANVIVAPLLTMAVPVGFTAILTGWSWPAVVAGWMLHGSQKVAEWHAHWEPNWRVPDPPFWIAAAFAGVVALAAVALRRRSRWGWIAAASSLALLAVIVVHPFRPELTQGWLELTAIDVGQGESLFLAMPTGETMLIDGGGFPLFGRRVKPKLEVGEDVVSPYLWSRGVRRLDVIMMTHAHDDHAGGLGAIVENFKPREFWVGTVPECETWSALKAKAERNGVRLRKLTEGETIDEGAVHFKVLAPRAGYVAGRRPENSDSLVLRVTYGERSMLLTGDADARTLGELAELGTLGHVDILKAGHHGSRTSNARRIVEVIHPAFAVISAGYDNSYHLPNADVLERFRDAQAMTLRTDLMGAVTIWTDGRRVTVDTDRWEQNTRARMDPF